MVKILVYSLLGLAVLSCFIPGQVLAATQLTNNQAPVSQIYAGTFDNLVLDFSLDLGQADVLKAVSLINLGTADYLYQIKNLQLWLDSGPVGWQGFGQDQLIGNLIYSARAQAWYLDNLAWQLAAESRLFVSVEAFSALERAGTIQLQIPKVLDDNQDNIWQLGDLGIFFSQAPAEPALKSLTNQYQQYFSTKLVDLQGPKIIVSNLVNNQIINKDNFTILGYARDQGNNQVLNISLLFNNVLFTDVNYNPTNYQWTWTAREFTEGDYDLIVRAEDNQGNLSQTVPIKFIVRKQALDLSQSQVQFSKTQLLSTGLDGAQVTVSLKDQFGQGMSVWPVQISAAPQLIIRPAVLATDNNGQLIFSIYCTDVGRYDLSLTVDNQLLISQVISVVNSQIESQNIKFGDLIKASGKGVYYYASNGKRYVFPDEKVYFSWYADFSTVKNISDNLLSNIPLGGNVTLRPGKQLLKIQSDPRVYVVDSHGVLRWIADPQLAIALYGANWPSKIIDLQDAFFTDYQLGQSLLSPTDFVPQAVLASISSINQDKNLK